MLTTQHWLTRPDSWRRQCRRAVCEEMLVGARQKVPEGAVLAATQKGYSRESGQIDDWWVGFDDVLCTSVLPCHSDLSGLDYPN